MIGVGAVAAGKQQLDQFCSMFRKKEGWTGVLALLKDAADILRKAARQTKALPASTTLCGSS